MMMGGGLGSWWLLLIVIPVVIAAAGVAVIAVIAHGRRGGGSLPGPGGHGSRRDRDLGRPDDDPLALLRERYARGEIGQEEFERRLDGLLRTEPPSVPGRGAPHD